MTSRALGLLLVMLSPYTATASAFPWRPLELDAAQRAARSEGRPLLVDVYTTWCEPCTRLERVVFGSPEVLALAPRFVGIRIDAEKGGGPDVVRRFGVERYPTTLFLRSDGTEWGRIEGFRELPGYLETLRAFLDGRPDPAGGGRAASPGGATIVERFARAFRSAQDLEPSAVALLANLEDEDASGMAGIRDQATLARAELLSALGRPQEAARLLVPLARGTSALAGDAAFALAVAQGRAGDPVAGTRLLVQRARKSKDPGDVWKVARYCATTDGAPIAAARKLVTAALDRSPRSDLLWLARADLDEAGGRPDMALEAVSAAAALRPELPYLAERAARLRSGSPREGGR